MENLRNAELKLALRQQVSTPDSLLNHSLGSKTSFSTPFPNRALAHFQLPSSNINPIPFAWQPFSSLLGRPSRLHDPPPFSKSPQHEVLSRSEAPGIWTRVGCFLAQDYTLPELGPFPSSRHRPTASLSHQVPGEDGGAGSSCFPVPFPLCPSAWLAPPSPTCQERDLISHLRALGCCYFCLTE